MGRPVQVVTQVSLILLLFGTVIGDFALLADVGQRALRRLSPSPPALLVDYDGRGIMVLLTLCVVLPLCLLRKCAPPILSSAEHEKNNTVNASYMRRTEATDEATIIVMHMHLRGDNVQRAGCEASLVCLPLSFKCCIAALSRRGTQSRFVGDLLTPKLSCHGLAAFYQLAITRVLVAAQLYHARLA